MKLKAGALLVSVTISFVIAVLISLLIMLAYYFKIQSNESLLQKKLDRNANSALKILIKDRDSEEEITSMDLYGEESDSVLITKKIWGVFEVLSAKAFSGKYSVVKTAQYGYPLVKELSPALYMTDLNRPVNICGKTNIVGTCYMPDEGVKVEYVEGIGFSGTRLKKETVKKSNNVLPPLNKKILKRLLSFFEPGAFSNLVRKEIVPSSIGDSLYNSFLDTTILVRTNGLNLKHKYLGGNIILYSTKQIIIDASTKLDGVLIFAPGLKIKKGFKGVVQAFVSDSILVEENCRLNYPSVLGLFKKSNKTPQPFIKFMPKTEITGIVFTSIDATITDQKETKVTLENETLLKGQLYVEGFATIKGEARGSVWCNKFYWESPNKGKYENYIVDVVIDRSKLSPHYVGSGLIATGRKKKIVKWLN